jgi:hypothetical protein
MRVQPINARFQKRRQAAIQSETRRRRWGGKLWMGDISKNAPRRAGSGRENQWHPARERTAGNPDVPNQAKAYYDRRPERALDKARSFLRPPAQKQSPGVESLGEA